MHTNKIASIQTYLTVQFEINLNLLMSKQIVIYLDIVVALLTSKYTVLDH